MPEGPEVRRLAEMLQTHLPGYYIINIGMDKDYKISQIKLPRKIEGITVKGKKLIFIFDNDSYLVNSLGMTGSWTWQKSKYSHLWFDLARSDEMGNLIPAGVIYYDDVRKYGTFAAYSSVNELHIGLKSVGPDLLNTNVSYELWLSIAKKYGKKQICEFLAEQKYLSGVGNVYRSEIAYEAKLNPSRLMSSLSDNELLSLYKASINVLRNAYLAGGYEEFNIYGNIGKYKTKVYGQVTDPSGNPVSVMTCNKRKVYWVDNLQK